MGWKRTKEQNIMIELDRMRSGKIREDKIQRKIKQYRSRQE